MKSDHSPAPAKAIKLVFGAPTPEPATTTKPAKPEAKPRKPAKPAADH